MPSQLQLMWTKVKEAQLKIEDVYNDLKDRGASREEIDQIIGPMQVVFDELVEKRFQMEKKCQLSIRTEAPTFEEALKYAHQNNGYILKSQVVRKTRNGVAVNQTGYVLNEFTEGWDFDE
jgi:hypothetical protein